tara:strand:- start:162 stop:512 length:351 start_codon:yes stop_codon:yes gene_type:complete
VSNLAEEPSSTERLMNALITKMEGMDGDLQLLKAENKRLRALYSNPEAMLKKAGFVKAVTPFSEDVLPDPFRNDEGLLMKNETGFVMPQSNEEFHEMSWEDIHEMAEGARSKEMIQ